MTIALDTASIILLAFGGIWLLQGIGVLPGSFMTGQLKWAAYGCIAIAIGIALRVIANRRRKHDL
jgi:hypothetical protein